jgi:glycosyltransferase involved in cell wall biosynthesis
LNILHITPYYAPAWSFGGVVSAVTGLAQAQADRGHRIHVLTTDALNANPPTRNPVMRETLSGVEVIRARNLSTRLHARFNLSIPLGEAAALRSFGPIDVIHLHELRTFGNLFALRAIPPGLPVVLSPHGTLPYGTGRSVVKRTWDRVFARPLLRRINHVAALTRAEAAEATTLWGALRVPFPGATPIPNGIPRDFMASGNLRARYDLGQGPVILFLGRLHERKGLQFLIPAFGRIAQDFPNARLLIVGPDAGMLESARTLAAGIGGQVIFTGLLTGGDLRAALASADLFVLPAIGEGLSMSAIEAMAAGLPLILTPGCNLPDLEQRGAGLIVPREIDPLADALRTLLGSPTLRRQMGQQGTAWVREAFTWDQIAEQLESLYTRLKGG